MSEQLDIPFDASNQPGRARLLPSPVPSVYQPSTINHQPPQPTDDQVRLLKRILTERGWMTRKALSAALEWTERTIRNVAEAAGADIVRGPLGFTIFERATNAEVEHAAHISISQGDKMQQYGTALLKRLAQRTA
jgi:hypothetical protein